MPGVFDETKSEWAAEREQLRDVLDQPAWDAARRTTINAHYTSPEIASALWQTLVDLGFTDGDVLEPGCGSGNFVGLAPETARMVGVELDPTTASIAQALYPHATIRAESFAATRLPDAHFDAVIGNVPFGNITLHDPAHNVGRHSMHNHFILKSLALTRPGGIVAVITSSFTLDSADPSARQEMSALADLVGAVRLPTGAHRRSAGTEALTDILILRRREPGRDSIDTTWEHVTARDLEGVTIRGNAYYDAHPEHILGTVSVGEGMYGAHTVHVTSPDLTGTPEQLRALLDRIVQQAKVDNLTLTPAEPHELEQRQATIAAHTHHWNGTIVAADQPYDVGGKKHAFHVAHHGYLAPLAVPPKQWTELRALLQLRDQATALLEAEAEAAPDETSLTKQRTTLRATYEAYRDRYGALNRFSWSEARRSSPAHDPDTGARLYDAQGQPVTEESTQLRRLVPPVMRTFRQDPGSPLVRALETFDENTQQGSPAGVLTQRQVVPRTTAAQAETPADALALSLDATGGVDLARIATLLGTDETTARTQLGDLVWRDPASGELIQAAEYLSGDVRTKLEQAEAAAATDAAWQDNVAALRAVLPDPIGIEEIEARLGSVWISPEVHQEFLTTLLGDDSITVENPLPGIWTVRTEARHNIRSTNEWGTPRRPAPALAEALMEQREIKVYDTVSGPDGRDRLILNPVDTTAAQEKAAALQDRFSEWVWEDPARANQLAETYNRRFNNIVLRDYSRAGDWLTLPGLAATITLRPHQRAAVARMIAEPAVGLFHQVGAGKTLEMIVGVTELRRMGLVRKPCVVVPNHMLEQITREWLQAYPTARILAASGDDLGTNTSEKRRLFVARAAANEWDAVVFTQGAFKKIGVSGDFQAEYIETHLKELRTTQDIARSAGASSVKKIEKAVLRAEERWKKALDIPRDPGVTFEATGVDYVVVDEAHMYKNLTTVSNISDAAIDGSQQAQDLHMKLEYLRARYGARVATLATATPLANSVTEAYVMQRYLRPDLLTAAGINSFDGWAATFGKTVTEMELGPAGDFRIKSRFASFHNVPELLRMWHVFADVKTAKDLNLPTPAIAQRSDGERDVETVVLAPTPELEDYIAHIAERADRVANREVPARADNMLLISTDGRKAALDLRLVDPAARQSGTRKLDVVASRILRHWHATRDTIYADPVTGDPSPLPGSLQLVFCDLGTPGGQQWNAYTDLKRLLTEGGIPANAIRFIHEAKNDAEKGRLFAAARTGHISVLIGSTAKMGVGTNVQARVSALHHIDCPWRPADIEQRDGRAIRQGNQNPEVALYRYVVERSFDAYSWQTVARKAGFIHQVMSGNLTTREIEDIGSTAFSAAEAKALASGNPLILDKANAEADLAKLRRQEVAHHRSQSALLANRDNAQRDLDIATTSLASLHTATARTSDVSGDNFHMTIDNRRYTSRGEAAKALSAWATTTRVDLRSPHQEPVPCGDIAGHVLLIGATTNHAIGDMRRLLAVELQDVPLSRSSLPADDVLGAGIGLIRTIENKTTVIPRNIQTLEKQAHQARTTITEASQRIGTPFPKAVELRRAQERLAEINQAIDAQLKPQPSSGEDSQDTSGHASNTDSIHPHPATQAAFPTPHRTGTPTTQQHGKAGRRFAPPTRPQLGR